MVRTFLSWIGLGIPMQTGSKLASPVVHDWVRGNKKGGRLAALALLGVYARWLTHAPHSEGIGRSVRGAKGNDPRARSGECAIPLRCAHFRPGGVERGRSHKNSFGPA